MIYRTETSAGVVAYQWTPTGGPLCPDVLRLEQIGAADNLRGRIVRLFFRILDRLMPVAGRLR